MELWRLTATEASGLMAAGILTSEEFTRALLARIAERDPLIRAWSWVDPEHALRQARERDREPRRGPLHGIPFGVKDVLNTRDLPTQHNSPIYENHRPGEDANSVAVLRAAGAVLLGKTETLEFASGGRKPLSRNPHNPAHSREVHRADPARPSATPWYRSRWARRPAARPSARPHSAVLTA